MNSLLDLQAHLRGDSPAPEPSTGDTMIGARPAMMSASEVDNVSVIEGDVEVIAGSAPRAEPHDLETPAPPAPESTTFWNTARAIEVPAPPAIDGPAGSDVPGPALQEPDLEIPPSPIVPQTREEQITELAERIDRLEQELAFVAEELWRLAGDPTPLD
ncbi:MAG: hypothetical protein M3P11_06160 [Actinomycetota bacterium]|nr:hypothetical protein [Actinomycetota bacterium]